MGWSCFSWGTWGTSWVLSLMPMVGTVGIFGEEAVVVSFAMAEAIAFGVEGEAGDEDQIQIVRDDGRVHLGVGFFEAEDSFFQGGRGGDEMKGHRLLG